MHPINDAAAENLQTIINDSSMHHAEILTFITTYIN